NDAVVVRIIGVMEVSFIHQDYRLRRCFGDEIGSFILRRETGGRIVRVTNVNKTCICHCAHLAKVVREVVGEWYLNDFRSINGGMLEDGLESWIARHQLSLRSRESVGAQLQNLTRSVS